MSSAHAKLSLAAKFGVGVDEAAPLLHAARQAADALGICFHVGSQAMSPQAYADAMERVRAAIVEAAVTVDVVDVGGGFPSIYPGMEPPPLERYFDVIHRAFEALPVSYSAELWCEPGRALCAEYASIVVRVEKRRGDELYINDGAYGALFDAAHIGWRFPVELVRATSIERQEAGVQLLRADVRRHGLHARAVHAARRRPGGRLYRDRHARRLWLRDADRVQRLRHGETVIVTDEPMASLYSVTEPSREVVTSIREAATRSTMLRSRLAARGSAVTGRLRLATSALRCQHHAYPARRGCPAAGRLPHREWRHWRRP